MKTFYVITLSLVYALGCILFSSATELNKSVNQNFEVLYLDDFEAEDDADIIYWTTENLEGWHYWHVIAWGGEGSPHCMRFENTDLAQNDWLITKQITGENIENAMVNFDVLYNAKGTKPKLYYTNKYNGKASESSWIEINYLLGDNENEWHNSGDIILENPGDTLYFAFQYKAEANAGIFFLLDNFKVVRYIPIVMKKAGESEHFEFYTNMTDSLNYHSALTHDLENQFAKLASLWNRPGINDIFDKKKKLQFTIPKKKIINMRVKSILNGKTGFMMLRIWKYLSHP